MHCAVCLATAAALSLFSFISAAEEDARLLRQPTVSHDNVAFAYAGDLWIVGREGGQARRITATPHVETDPHFSPDGSQIAFTATVKGNTDVYVVPSGGGAAQRLTYHPGLDLVRGWTHDGRHVMFGSARGVLPTPRVSSYVRLWVASLDGGLPEMLPLARAWTGAFSPDGRRFAYEEFSTAFETREGQWQSAQWRHYRGGRTHPIRVANLTDLTEKTLPWSDSNDSDPMWIGDKIYFISDRNFTANLFAYDTGSGEVEQLTRHEDYDIMYASAGADAIVYEQAGFIHLLDTRSDDGARRLRIRIEGDFPWARPQMKDAGEMLRNAALSPDGSQIALEARGEVFVRNLGSEEAFNLTQTAGTHDRNPAWSAAGTRLAWLSDASGEYQLHIGEPEPDETPQAIELPRKGYYSTPVWSPDGHHLLVRDNRLTLWMIELPGGQATRIDADTYDDPRLRIDPAWSVDSRWIAYSKKLPNHLRAIFLYSLDDGTVHQVTDSLIDAVSPAFDRGGAYLYFLASIDYAQNVEWSGMNSLDRPVTRGVHAAVLSAKGASPIAPQAADVDRPAKPAVSGIDIEGLSRRVALLDIPRGDYADLVAGPAGTLFYSEYEKSGVHRLLAPKSLSLKRYNLGTRTSETFLESIDAHSISSDGTKLLYRKAVDNQWAVADAGRAADADDAEVVTGDLDMRVEPRAEWAHIFREAWRNQRNDFYQSTMHGANWQSIYEKYAPFVHHVNHRADLGYLLAMVGGELAVGHSALAGAGDTPRDESVSVGMLGVDYVVDRGRYRIQRIYTGDPWDPALRAPLAVPGLDVREGEYLLEVNGKPVIPPGSVYAPFEGTANELTEIRVGPAPHASRSRLVSVIPVPDEEPLRTYEDWIEKNRRLVDALSDGRIGYLWLPDTGPFGYQAFNRQFYGQLDKQGLIVDVRYNQGGFIADYVVETLTRPLRDYLAMRHGAIAPMPMGAIHGPKVMVVNESAGSGGDALPYHFKLAKAGPLVGTRTWGGLVGATTPPPDTLDGGGMTVPSAAFYDSQGQWLLENVGIAPDIEVENTSAAVLAGRDPQLERAVEVALKLLESSPPRDVPRPAPPDRVTRPSTGTP